MNLRGLQFTRVMYGLFIAISIYYTATNNIMSAGSNMLIALIFDPFDQSVTFNNRPKWQQVWLIVHVVLGLAAFIYGTFQ